ncbi:hypothetical protein ACHAWF_003903 [Thalassiosira exigua]
MATTANEAAPRRRRRPRTTAEPFRGRLAAAALSSLALASLASGGSLPDGEPFPSSVVGSPFGEDLALDALSSRRPARRADRHGRGLFAGRDAVRFEGDDGVGDVFSDVDGGDGDDPLASILDRRPVRPGGWRSPLESLAPLPTLSLGPEPDASTLSLTKAPPPPGIDPAPRHPHRIDIDEIGGGRARTPSFEPKLRSTGTTIAALLASDSTVLILAADTRATDGSTVADPRCEKLHALARNVWCAGAGTSADCDALVRLAKFAFWKRGATYAEGRGVGNAATAAGASASAANHWDDLDAEDRDVPPASVPAVLCYLRRRLRESGGRIGANLLAGGYDPSSRRAYLAAIHPHGSMDVVTDGALGSGGLAATGVLEARYARIGGPRCSVEDGIRLVVDAVGAGIENDLGSGSQVDVCVVGEGGVLYRRAAVGEEEIERVEAAAGGRAPEALADGPYVEESAGVNGFGNVPFAVQSKRLVVGGGDSSSSERERRRWLDEVLGDPS